MTGFLDWSLFAPKTLPGTLSNGRNYPGTKLQDARRMFFFFSNRLGCLGSLLVSGLITLALLLMFGIVRL
jgi:hypothetical protein